MLERQGPSAAWEVLERAWARREERPRDPGELAESGLLLGWLEHGHGRARPRALRRGRVRGGGRADRSPPRATPSTRRHGRPPEDRVRGGGRGRSRRGPEAVRVDRRSGAVRAAARRGLDDGDDAGRRDGGRPALVDDLRSSRRTSVGARPSATASAFVADARGFLAVRRSSESFSAANGRARKGARAPSDERGGANGDGVAAAAAESARSGGCARRRAGEPALRPGHLDRAVRAAAPRRARRGRADRLLADVPADLADAAVRARRGAARRRRGDLARAAGLPAGRPAPAARRLDPGPRRARGRGGPADRRRHRAALDRRLGARGRRRDRGDRAARPARASSASSRSRSPPSASASRTTSRRCSTGSRRSG